MSLLSFLEWLARTEWSVALHESLYMYPLIESTHVLSLTVFVGLAVILDLRLLGLAFDPLYASNGRFYIHYNPTGTRRSVISRFRVSASANAADPASEEIILTVRQDILNASNHKGGMIAFGPDGMLYIALGDGGGGGDPLGSGQDRSSLLGKVLRLDVRGAGGLQGVVEDV